MTPTSKKTLGGGAVGAIVGAILFAVFSMEGGHVNDPGDPGGETNHGITVAVARAHGYEGAMKDLPKDVARQIYYQSYVVAPGFLPLVQIQPVVAHELIDTGVNTGTGRASRWFQQSLNTLSRGGRDYPQIAVDGVIGPNTLAAYQNLERVRGRIKACEMTLKLLDAHQAMHYAGLTSLSQFVVGWVDHRVGNVDPKLCGSYLP